FATVGVFLSADLYTTFILFEIMSFTSYVWVAFDEKKESLKAAETYLAVAVIGGLAMLMGLFLLYDLTGTLDMDLIGPAARAALENGGGYLSPAAQLYTAGGLLLFGFGAKAGCFPLHIWLPKAHPVAPAPASALLSGILTKAGVFGIIVITGGLFFSDGNWGLLLTVLGLVTMLLGALLALLSVNLKRTLACSSISQIGFILTGIGMAVLLSSVGEENGLAVWGTFLHMVNHSLFKLVLFLCAGAVYMNLHKLNLNDIRGFGRKKPALGFCFLMGSLGIGGIPLRSGYVSKTLLHESMVEYAKAVGEGAAVLVNPGMASASAGMPGIVTSLLLNPGIWKAAEWVFLLTGGMTVAYMLKLFIAIFVEKHPTEQAKYDAMSTSCMKPLSRFVLVGCSALIPLLGMTPHLSMDRIARAGEPFFQGDEMLHSVAYFSLGNLKGGVISVGIGVVLYVLVVRLLLMKKDERGTAIYADRLPSWLDLENLVYRPLLLHILPGICGTVCALIDRYLVSTVVTVFLAVSSVVCRAMDSFVDGLILLARKTTHRQLPGTVKIRENDRLAYILGGMADEIAAWKGRRGRNIKTDRTSAIPRFIEAEEELKRTGKLVEESFSFGLMLFCIGLCLTLGYLLAVFLMG
ncbi:MAG: complex I subunit 5 family protein, partial [Hungatella sp.]